MAKHILIVDDDMTFIMLTRRKLEDEGFEVDEATSGGDIRQRVEKNNYDLVLMDYQIPDMMGDELCSLIREKDSAKNLPIIMMTANQSRGEAFFKDAGATEVLYKPVDYDALLGTIHKLVPKDA